MKYTVPFYSNTSDDTHCYQAAVRMIAKYFWPSSEYSWEELEKVTAKVPGLWTWPTAGLLWLQSKGASIIVEEQFDYQRFTEFGAKYLLDFYGPEVGAEQVKQSDIPQEIALAKQAVKQLDIHKKIPDTQTIVEYLKKGYLLICNINAKVLNHQSGYVGHFVVLIGYDEDMFYLHDPGLPPQQARKVSFTEFNQAWSYPDESARNLIAIKV